ncbi:TIGR00725 family protein [Malonomonas rubra]|uniref:TIGR00725 family protein n=1 Tax=Malonomonas rubra TaxID=57040 RepID=UPI0026EDE3B5|nr:TIGR00725 family protein [Malonomonas rubra]
MKKRVIGVIGAGQVSAAGAEQAYRVGRLIAENGCVLVCGGLGGVMAAAAKGCSEAGGDVLGILPGATAESANPYVNLPIVTNMGHARNVIIAHTADVLIAIEGEYGTLSEMAISLKLGKRVVQLEGRFRFDEAVVADSAEEAVALAMKSFGGLD